MGAMNDRNFFRVDAFAPVLARVVLKEEMDSLTCELLPDMEAYNVMLATDVKRVNISGAGMYFESDISFSLGDIIRVALVFKDIYAGIVVLYGKVIRSGREGRHFGIAMDFMNIDQVVIDVITRFVLQRERELIAEKKVGWL